MHWDAQIDDGKGELLFGRPIRWLLFLYGGRVVPFTIARLAIASSPRVQDVTSGAVTYGHRFLATSGRAGRAIKVRSFDEYRKKLAENFVLLSRIDRRDRIVRDLEAQARRLGGRAAAASARDGRGAAGGSARPGRVPGRRGGRVRRRVPVAARGSPDDHADPPSAFLSGRERERRADAGVSGRDQHPRRQRPAGRHQRRARRHGAAARRPVLLGRGPARQPRGPPRPARHAPVSQGTRVVSAEGGPHRAAGRLDRREVFGQPDEAPAAVRAAALCKADLATDMVREFTGAAGRHGRHLRPRRRRARGGLEGDLPPLPAGGGRVDRAAVGRRLGAARVTWAAVALADKLDTLVGLFLAGERPTGSRDPFGLRRQAHGVLRLLLDVEALTGVEARPSIGSLLEAARREFGDAVSAAPDADAALETFVRERLESMLEQRGADARNVRAVVRGRALATLRPLDVARNLAELPAFAETESFRQLAEAFKRVRNIARELDQTPETAAAGWRAALQRAGREGAAGGDRSARPRHCRGGRVGPRLPRRLHRGGRLRAGRRPLLRRGVRHGRRRGAAPRPSADAQGTSKISSLQLGDISEIVATGVIILMAKKGRSFRSSRSTTFRPPVRFHADRPVRPAAPPPRAARRRSTSTSSARARPTATGTLRDLLGGKGANLAEMTNAGLPVPPGFTISTEACTLYYEHGGRMPPVVDQEMLGHLKKLEAVAARVVRVAGTIRCSCRCARAPSSRCPA